ncbi:MAG: DUF3575 domain-containing protein [Cyclobacteriaceae bacterium]|nr:DUF3575 domain-containing protein [Cyclobacteriaceae bacterium]
MKTAYLLLWILGIAGYTMAQEVEETPQRLNTIKIEFTQPLYPNSFVLSYERVTKPNQSFCVTGGYEEFPNLVSLGDRINLRKNLDKGGFKVGGEYRFYLAKENKFKAPRGVYVGPYVSFHDYNNRRDISVDVDGNPEDVTLSTDFQILNIGFELGYQFVINNRWSLDFVVVGPSVSNYRAKIKLDGEYTFDKEDIQNEIILKLLDRFPLLEDVLTDKEVSSNGVLDSWAYGWRYQLLVGYHFGRKK